MRLHELRHWQWVIIGILVGGMMAVVTTRYAAEAEPAGPYESMSGPMFESLLLQKNQQSKQYPGLLSLQIQPYHGRQVAVATYLHQGLASADPSRRGGYLPGKISPRKFVFVPQTEVYLATTPQFAKLTSKPVEVRVTLAGEPASNIEEAMAKAGFQPNKVDASASASASASPNVRIGRILPRQALALSQVPGVQSVQPTDGADSLLGFIKKVESTQAELKVEHRYAWWLEARYLWVLWMSVGVIGIGGIWPFIVNLMTYHRLTRPPEEKGIDLSKVSSHSPEPAKMTPVDPAAIQAHLRQLEENLGPISGMGVGAIMGQKVQSDCTPEPAVRQLANEALPAVAAEEHKPKHYAGQFYPTETHAPKE